jgi:hypothetical protein
VITERQQQEYADPIRNIPVSLATNSPPRRNSKKLRQSAPRHISKSLAKYLLGLLGRDKEVSMENYQDTMAGRSPSTTEDQFTKTVEEYTASIPSSAFLGVAVAAMGASLLFQVAGQGKWGNFIAQWVPTWLIIGLYNKIVKLEGHDKFDRSYSH